MEKNEQDNRDILSELLKYEKKELRQGRIASLANMILVVAVLIALAVLLPRAMEVFTHIETSMTEVDELIRDAGMLIHNTNDLVEDNADALTDTVERMQSVDFDKLNQAITDLQEAVTPLVEFSRFFGGNG